MATKLQKVEEVDSLDDLLSDEPLKVTQPKMVSENAIKNHMEHIGEEEGVTEDGVKRTTKTGLKDEDFKELDKDVEDILESVKQSQLESQDFKELVMMIDGIGIENARRNAASTQRLLDRPLRHVKDQAGEATTKVVKELNELRSLTVKLNPGSKSLANNKFFGITLPFGMGRKVDNVLQNFASAKDQLDEVANNLRIGRDELEADNIAMEEEKKETWTRMNEFEQLSYMVEKMYKGLEVYVEKIEKTDSLRAGAIRQEVMFPLGQKRMDILQDMTVAMNTYLSYQTIAQNNRELIRGVNRAINTALPALQQAVIQSQILDRQEVTMKVINDLNETTAQMMVQNAERIEIQGGAIARSATSATLNVEALQRSSEALLRTIDGLEKFREEALTVMDSNVAALKEVAGKARNGVDKVAQNRAGNALKESMKEQKEDVVLSSGKKKVRLK